MCGIIGVTGDPAALGVLLEGLHRLEYRGYDSAGVALVVPGEAIWRKRRAGGTKSLPELMAAVDDAPAGASCGIGHNRWATHGGPTERNAHPHTDASGKLALIHNGIIDNYRELAATLPQGGAELQSETDSEVLAHVIAARMASTGMGLADAARAALRDVHGKFSIAVVHVDEPDLIVGARRGSPLICGLNATTAFLASDIPAIHGQADEFFVIDDERVVELRPGSVRITTLDGDEVAPERREVTWDLAAAEKGGYPDFMLKEIHEQPDAVRDTLLGRIEGDGVVALDDSQMTDDDLRRIDKVFVVGCGTSYNAGLVGELAIEHWAKLAVESDIASEFRYRDPVLSPTSLVIAISQSGESLDTMEAVNFAKQQEARVLTVCNVVDSSMARDSDAVIYTHAGPEICVASTKTHVAQIAALNLLALQLAQVRGTLYREEAAQLVRDLQLVPEKIETAMAQADHVKEVAEKYRDIRDVFFIGRQVGRAMAQEGALKLKELSYVRAEAYPAGELKHGPIALIEPGTLVVAIATRTRLLDKIIANIQEVKARGASILAVATDDGEGGVDPRIADLADDVFLSPYAGHELFTPMVDIVPLQLFAYYLAKSRGNDVDKPRNLAKTVTVE